MRRIKRAGFDTTIPYIVNGAGGHAVTPAPDDINFSSGEVTYANGAPQKALVPAHDSRVGYGYLTVTVKPAEVVLAYTLVQDSHRQPFETTTIPLK
jgi:hypothetical protein